MIRRFEKLYKRIIPLSDMKKGNGLKKWSFLVVVVVLVLVLGFIFFSNEKSTGGLNEIDFELSWFHGGFWGYAYVADYNGYFADEGLSVTLHENKGSTITSSLIGSGQSPIGIVSADVALMAKSKGVPLTVVAIIDKVSHAGLTCHTDVNLSDPKNLEGKKIGVTRTSNTYQQFLMFAKMNDIDLSKIEEIPISGAGQEFIAGAVDCHALSPFVTKSIADLKGVETNTLVYYDHGLNMYSHGIVVNDDYLEENPEIVQRVVNAILKGFKYEQENPEEALRIMLEENPELNAPYEEKLFYMRNEFNDKLFGGSDPTDGLQDLETWQNTEDIMDDLGFLDSDVNLEEFFTNEFVTRSE